MSDGAANCHARGEQAQGTLLFGEIGGTADPIVPLRKSGISRLSPELASPLHGVNQLRRVCREEISGWAHSKEASVRNPQSFTHEFQGAASQVTREKSALCILSLRADLQKGETGVLPNHPPVRTTVRDNGYTLRTCAGCDLGWHGLQVGPVVSVFKRQVDP